MKLGGEAEESIDRIGLKDRGKGASCLPTWGSTKLKSYVSAGQVQAGGLSVEPFIGQFYSSFFGVVNLAGVLTQLFLVSRILKYLGVHTAVLFLPRTRAQN